MKVELKISRAGNGFVQNVGEEIEVSAEEGKRLIEAGKATLVRFEKRETAVKKPKREKAVKNG